MHLRLLLPVLLALIAGSLAPSSTRAAATCEPFGGFPLSVNVGTAPGGGDGESLRCFAMKMQAAFRTLGSANGIAGLDGEGRLRAAQMPAALAPVFVGLSQIGSVNTTFAGTQNPNAILFGAGNRISFCPALSCIYGTSDGANIPSFYDHQRASLLVSATTQDDARSEEQTLAVTTTINKGYMKSHAANTAYALGDNVKVGKVVYRVVQAGTTGANSAPQGTRPNAAQGGQYQALDGSVRFQWINDVAIAAKVGSYFETKVEEGAGGAWNAAFNYHLNAVPKPGMFLQGVEIDYTNSGGDCPIGIDCTALRIALGGKQITHGLYLEGSTEEAPTAIWGFRTAGRNLAQFAAIAEDSGSPVGLGFNVGGYGSLSPGSSTVHHAVAAIQDNSVSPVGLLITGAKSAAQIQGNNFSVAPDGAVTVLRLRETAPRTIPTATTACVQGERAYDANYEYRCVDTNTWKRAALSSW